MCTFSELHIDVCISEPCSLLKYSLMSKEFACVLPFLLPLPLIIVLTDM